MRERGLNFAKKSYEPETEGRRTQSERASDVSKEVTIDGVACERGKRGREKAVQGRES